MPGQSTWAAADAASETCNATISTRRLIITNSADPGTTRRPSHGSLVPQHLLRVDGSSVASGPPDCRQRDSQDTTRRRTERDRVIRRHLVEHSRDPTLRVGDGAQPEDQAEQSRARPLTHQWQKDLCRTCAERHANTDLT